MAVNLISQLNTNNSSWAGITFAWSGLTCHVYGTSTAISVHNLAMSAIGSTPFRAGRTYQVVWSSTGKVQFHVYAYVDSSWSTQIQQFIFWSSGGTFTIPDNCGAIIVRLWVGNGQTLDEYVSPEVYEITYTDVDADCDMMQHVLGWPNADFYTIWLQFSGGLPWDGQSCSEIACCISYLAGNVSKIYVSNYAEGMARLYQANGRFGTTPSRGAFIWFDYDHDGIPDHTGRVYDVSNGIITTVEGNVYSYVAQFTYSVNDPSIYGYGYPNYDYDPVPVPPGPEPGGNQGTYDRIRRRRAERFY